MLQRTLPAGFIAPCLPTKTDKLPSGSQWLHEIKHDGFRIVAQKEGDNVRLITRNRYDFTDRYPLIVDAVRSLPAKSCIVTAKGSWSIRMAYRYLTLSGIGVMTMPRLSAPSI
jgi:ATP dependent DNA ligase domain